MAGEEGGGEQSLEIRWSAASAASGPKKPPKELGTADRQCGTQTLRGDLERCRSKGREWGTQTVEPSPWPLPPDWKTLHLLGHFLEAIGAQLSTSAAIPKNMANVVGVLSSLTKHFMPRGAYAMLTGGAYASADLPHLAQPLPTSFKESALRLPHKPPKEILIKAIERSQHLSLQNIARILDAYAGNMETTDRAVKVVLSSLAKDGLLHSDDLHEYHILISVQMKTTLLNIPLAMAPLLAAHAVCEDSGLVRLRRRYLPPILIPPPPTALSLRLTTALLAQLAAAISPPSLALWAGRELGRVYHAVPACKGASWSTAVVRLSVLTGYLETETSEEEAAKLRSVGAKLRTRLSADHWSEWSEAEEMAESLAMLCSALRLCEDKWAEALGRLKTGGVLAEVEEKDPSQTGKGCGEVLPLTRLAALAELTEVAGPCGELSARAFAPAECSVGEGPRAVESVLGPELIGAYVEAVTWAPLDPPSVRRRRGRLLERVEKAQVKLPPTCVAYIRQGAELPKQITIILAAFVGDVKLTKAHILPVLLRLKGGNYLTQIQFSTLYTKPPYPLPYLTFRAILDKVLAWPHPRLKS